MEFMSEGYNKVTNYPFPNQDAGYTAIIKEYRDEVGRITKVAIDILPITATITLGPLAGAITATAIAGGKAAYALYDWMVHPTSKENIEALPTSPEAQGIARVGATLMSTVLHLIRKGGVIADPSIEHIKAQRDVLSIAEQALQGKRDALIQKIARETFNIVVPEVAIQLFRVGADPIAKVLKLNDLRNNVNELISAIGSIKYKRGITRSEKAAIELAGGSAKTISAIAKHALEAKASYGKKKTIRQKAKGTSKTGTVQKGRKKKASKKKT